MNDLRFIQPILQLVIAGLLISTGSGCATRGQKIRSLQASYFGGDLATAENHAAELLQKKKADSNVIELDRAMVQLVSGKPAQAEQTLRKIRDEFEYLQQASAKDEIFSLTTDDTHRAYAGEDYERLLICNLLSLTNLMTDGQDAGAYVLQAVELQEELLRSANQTTPFKRVALGPYIRAALLEEKHNNFDDITRSRIQVANWERGFRDAAVDLARAESGRHSAPGHGVVYVFALVGRGPYKEEVSEEPTSAALLIADRILSATGKHTLPPTVAPVKVAAVRASKSGPDTIQVSVDGRPAGTTATISDIGELAVAQYAAHYPTVVARAVVRRVIKKSAVYALKERTGAHRDPLLDLALNVGGVAWEATEKADTRCWHLLPDRVQVLRIELPAGSHDLQLQAIRNGVAMHKMFGTKIQAEDGRNSYVLASFPDNELLGKILTSSRRANNFRQIPALGIQNRRIGIE